LPFIANLSNIILKVNIDIILNLIDKAKLFKLRKIYEQQFKSDLFRSPILENWLKIATVQKKSKNELNLTKCATKLPKQYYY